MSAEVELSDKKRKEELNELMEKIMQEYKLDWQSIYLWVMNQGNVILTNEEFDNMEVIDQDGPCY